MSVVHEDEVSVSEEDALRARFYRFLARLLARPADGDFLSQLAGMSGDDTPLGAALFELGALAREATVDDIEDAYNRLFIGVTRGELVPYASYYLTGFLNEKPLAALRGDMAKLGIKRADDVAEPEDHIASVAEMMAGMIEGDFGIPSTLCAQRDFFNTHLAPWAEKFFSDLEAAEGATLYRPVGTVGRLFMAIEAEGFSMVG